MVQTIKWVKVLFYVKAGIEYAQLDNQVRIQLEADYSAHLEGSGLATLP